MFDVSIAELFIVGIAGLLLLGPQELLNSLRALKKFKDVFKSYYNEFTKYLSEELNDNDDFIKIIIDEHGQPQKVYDFEKIKPHIINSEIDDIEGDNDTR